MFAWLGEGQTSVNFFVSLRLTCKNVRVSFVFLIKYLWKLQDRSYTNSQQSTPHLFFSIPWMKSDTAFPPRFIPKPVLVQCLHILILTDFWLLLFAGLWTAFWTGCLVLETKNQLAELLSQSFRIALSLQEGPSRCQPRWRHTLGSQFQELLSQV